MDMQRRAPARANGCRRGRGGMRIAAAGVAMLCALGGAACHGAEVAVAVAANFRAPFEVLAADFARRSGHRVVAAYGSTGKFYAQIRNGAPFAVLLAADSATPQRLERDGAAVPGSRFTYAFGALVLWSAQPGLVDAQGAVLRTAAAGEPPVRLALADPALAPYGAAALQALRALGLDQAWRPRLVQGEDITQAYQFVASGNAALGFVARSQVFADGALLRGSAWVVPQELYAPIRQDAVLLAAGRGNAAAVDLLQFLRGAEARARMAAFGYRTEPAP